MSAPHYRTCNLCEAMCGVTITTSVGATGAVQIASIKGDPADPLSKGHVCAKAIGLKSLQDDPDRLRVPMQRTADGWREISWDQAFDEVDQGIRRVWKKHGRDAVGFYAGNPTVHSLGAMTLLGPLVAALRTKNRFSATSVDQLPQMLASLQMFGHQLLLPIPDVDHTDFMLMLGANPAASNGSLMSAGNIMERLQGIVDRGGRVVILDPRRSETAHALGEHHFIRPETDAYFLAALLNTLFAEQLATPGALIGKIKGLESLAVAVAPFTPEAVAPLTGIPAETIRTLARDFARAKRAVCYGRVGICTQEAGSVSAWLVNAINIVTGNLDAVGGALFPHPAVDIVGLTSLFPALRGSFNRYRSRVRGLPEFNGELPVAVLAEEILTEGDGQIRALVTHAGNVALSTPDGRQVEKALEGLDFMVSIDFYLNETTRHANIILPPSGPLERGHYDFVFNALAVRNVSKYSPPLLTKDASARHDWQILIELAARLAANSIQERWLWKGVKAVINTLQPEGILDWMLRTGPYGGLSGSRNRVPEFGSRQLLRLLHLLPASRGFARRLEVWLSATAVKGKAQGLSLAKLQANPHGVDLGALHPSLAQRLCTRDGKIHLAPAMYLTALKELRTALVAVKSGKKQPKSDDFLLIGRRHVRSNNSWLHNSQPLIKGRERCTAQLHSSDAVRLSLKNGDQVKVKSRVGQITLSLEISDDIMPGVVSIPHGFGHHRRGTRMTVAEARPGVSLNDITDARRIDSISGNAAFNGVPVKVSPATKSKIDPSR